MVQTFRGGCLCGAARYVIESEGGHAMFLCHCSRCRRESGTVHCANVFFADARLAWDQGADNLGFYALPGTRKQRAFCKTCGSPVPRVAPEGQVVLPAGSLDSLDSLAGASLEPTAHIYCASKAAWEDDLAAAPRFDALPLGVS